MDHGNPTLPIPNLSLCTRLSRGLEVGHCHEERSGRPVLCDPLLSSPSHRVPSPVVKDHSHVQGFCRMSVLLVLFLTQKTPSKSCVQRPQAQPQLAGKR